MGDVVREVPEDLTRVGRSLRKLYAEFGSRFYYLFERRGKLGLGVKEPCCRVQKQTLTRFERLCEVRVLEVKAPKLESVFSLSP